MRPEPDRVERVAVIGAGTIRASWATLFLAKGLEVAVYDPKPDAEQKIRAFIENAMRSLERLDGGIETSTAGLTFHADPEDAAAGATFVQESGPENLKAKRNLYARLEPRLTQDTVVSSSTSGFMPSELREGRVGAGRYIVGHPFNPPHLIPLVGRLLHMARQEGDTDRAGKAGACRQSHAGRSLSRSHSSGSRRYRHAC